MQSMQFWADWPKQHKLLFLSALTIFVLALIFMFSFSLAGADASINWESLVQTEIMETVLDSFRVYPFTLQVNVENLVFLEWMGGSDININFFATYTYLILLASSLSVILAVSTTLSRFWFLVANTLFIVVLIALKLDLVMLFESTNRLALVFALVAFLPTSYYFHAINKNFSLAFRIITFLTITGLLALTIHFFSGVERPFLHLAAYGMTVPLILSLLFIIMVAHDIMAAFLNALSSGSMGTTGNWKHFFIISFIYLANLLILYLNETHVIEWDVLPVNHFVLVAISAILGIWGFRQREPQYEYLASFQPGGALFFLAMGTIFFSSTGYFMANGNDPVIEVFKDIIIYSHFAYGLIFLMYIAANFLSAFTKNLPIHRILYKPQTMPYFTYRLVGLITMAAFIFLQSWKVPVQYSFSGYFNNLGDLYKINGDPLMARGYYEEGSIYGQKNHHSNYGLAKIAEEENDVEKAINYYKNAIERRPTPYSLTNLSNIQYNQNMYFDALFTLQEGRKKFPDNGPVQNNLGLLYLQSGILDSSLFYLEQSENSGTSGNAAKNNIMVVLAKSEMKISTDSIIGIFEQDDAVFHANSLAFKNSRHSLSTQKLAVEDSSLNRFTHAYIYNYLINQLWSGDTTSFPLIKKLGSTSDNYFFTRRITLGLALNYYYKGNVGKALSLIKSVTSGEPVWAGKINHLIGLWYMQLGEFKLAVNYLAKAEENWHAEAPLHHAIALAKLGERDKSIEKWDSLAHKTTRGGWNKMATQVLEVLHVEKIEEAMALDDARKYQWFGFNKNGANEAILETFNSDDYKARAWMDLAQEELWKDHPDLAKSYFQKTEQLKINQPDLLDEMRKFKIRLYALNKDITALEKELNKGELVFTARDVLTEKYYQAMIYMANGDSLAARPLFDTYAHLDPFNEDFIIAASAFYDLHHENDYAYNMLQQALDQNPNSIRLQKAYILLCGTQGHFNFGFFALEKLLNEIPDTEFTPLIQEFDRRIEAWRNAY